MWASLNFPPIFDLVWSAKGKAASLTPCSECTYQIIHFYSQWSPSIQQNVDLLVDLELGVFVCPTRSSRPLLDLFDISKLCDDTNDCIGRVDENNKFCTGESTLPASLMGLPECTAILMFIICIQLIFSILCKHYFSSINKYLPYL